MTNWDWDGENFSYPASSSIGSPTEEELLAEDLAIEEADKQL
jgi:hypothetical protein